MGLSIARICPMWYRSGLKPPWQQNILSSITAATGSRLNTSVNILNSFVLYLLLPGEQSSSKGEPVSQRKPHIRRRSRKSCRRKRIRGCPSGGRSSRDIWFCRRAEGRWFPETACLCRRSRRGRGSLIRGEIRRSRRVWGDLGTARGRLLKSDLLRLTMWLQVFFYVYKRENELNGIRCEIQRIDSRNLKWERNVSMLYLYLYLNPEKIKCVTEDATLDD